MTRVDREGLCNEVSAEIFMQWYTFGGINQGLTLTEILEMPSWLRKDFRYILSQLSLARKRRVNSEKIAREMNPPKKAKKNGRT